MHLSSAAPLLPHHHPDSAHVPHQLLLQHDPHNERSTAIPLNRTSLTYSSLGYNALLLFYIMVLSSVFDILVFDIAKGVVFEYGRRTRYDCYVADIHHVAEDSYTAISYLYDDLALSKVCRAGIF